MPTYEYRCRECGDELEVVQSFSDDPLDTCPSCGGPLRKVFAAPGISFKGSGFYKTDSKGGSSSTVTANGEKSDKADKSEKSDSSSEKSGEKSGDSSSSTSGDSSSSTKDSGSSSKSPSKSDSGSSSSTKASTPA